MSKKGEGKRERKRRGLAAVFCVVRAHLKMKVVKDAVEYWRKDDPHCQEKDNTGIESLERSKQFSCIQI